MISLNPEFRTVEYFAWRQMRRRCNSSSHQDYAHYGGRGIRISERWDSYSVFLRDMGRRPPKYSLDRIDVNGNYEPGNCRWADWKTQERNRRNNVLISHAGKTQCVSAWAEDLGICRVKLWKHFKKHGDSVEKALASITGSYVWKSLPYQGKQVTMHELAESLGCNYNALKKYLRLNSNDVEKAVRWYSRKRGGA